MGRTEFHPDAHPKATEITGNRDYGEWGQCIAHATSADRRCRQPAKGPHGKCRGHGGSEDSGAPEGNTNGEGNDGGAPEENTNAVSHGAYVEEHKFYNEVLDEPRRAIVDQIFQEYLEEATSMHGELPIGDEIEIFNIAVMHGKHLNLEDWSVDRPQGLDSGHALVDMETKQTKYGEQRKYKESVVAKLQQKLSRERRALLKHYGLDKSAESKAADAMAGLQEAWKQSAQGGDSEP